MSMLERVALAIARQSMPGVKWVDLLLDEQEMLSDQARAALQALEKPDVGTILAGVAAAEEGAPTSGELVLKVWQAALKHILENGE